jgi:Na+/phosphate symporter
LGTQSGFFALGRSIHHHVGAKRTTYLTNTFFGMVIGVIKATLEVTFFLIAWNALSADPNVKQALNAIGTATNITNGSLFLPFFQHLVPASSPISKFF